MTNNKVKKHGISRRKAIGLSVAAVAVTATGAYLYLGSITSPSTTTSSTTTTMSTPTTSTTTSSPTTSSSTNTSTTSTTSLTSTTTTPTTTSTTTTTQGDYIKLVLESSQATAQPSSDIFVVNGTTGHDDGFNRLMGLMNKNNLLLYNSAKEGQEGLISKDDVILIKVNSQWNERGGTNTDLIKTIIEAIKSHPDGFVGEIVVADNGQGPGRGSLSDGGHLDYEKNNAEDVSQSVQKVVDSSAGSFKISTYLWDNITLKKVEEYSKGDMEDGYVVQENVNEKTGIQVSYPKFKTSFGTYISFKNGIWDNQTKSYNSVKLKVINVPVLKTHSVYGVTGCTKHYMGVPSDRLTGGSSTLGNTHLSIGKGGMGTLMTETRIPTLNILDAIWINARPQKGPQTYYDTAIRVNVIMASKDPIALDYWATKHVLLQVAQVRGYPGPLYTLDPDFVPNIPNPSIFSTWIKLSMEEIKKTGYQTTLKEDEMNVYVANLQ